MLFYVRNERLGLAGAGLGSLKEKVVQIIIDSSRQHICAKGICAVNVARRIILTHVVYALRAASALCR
jgi:hypothetical protein